ncbi:MAG: phosphotransferase [Planctomycetes bacterium]|nr:phosphotransferase [Planctomycetota bacterium]
MTGAGATTILARDVLPEPKADDSAIARSRRALLLRALRLVHAEAELVVVMHVSRRGGLALIRLAGELSVFKLITCQADWKKRLARPFGWNPARRAHAMSAALLQAGIPVCPVTEHGELNLPEAPRALWTISRFVPGACNLRELKAQAQPGVRAPATPAMGRLLGETLRLLRRLHDAGFEHRDYHPGNLLVNPGPGGNLLGEDAWLSLVDLETVVQRKATAARRARDLRRLLETFADRRASASLIDDALHTYAGDDKALAERIVATRRMAGLRRRLR